MPARCRPRAARNGLTFRSVRFWLGHPNGSGPPLRSELRRRRAGRTATATAVHCNGWQPFTWGHQMLEADQWPHVLANVRGTIVRGTERISSNRLLDLLGVDADPVLRQKVAKRLRAPMRALGWQGPRPMRITGQEGHAAGCSGYWRPRSR